MNTNLDTDVVGLFSLATLWARLLSGELSITDVRYSEGRCHAEIQPGTGRSLAPGLGRLLERFLLGESQKALAVEHDLSVGTIATHCARALHHFTTGTSASRSPIIVVMAAHAAHGFALEPAVVQAVEPDGPLCVHVEVPGQTFADRLAPSEHAVALLSIRGLRHDVIAHQRGTTFRTVSNQLAACFLKLGVSGRSALRAKAIAELSAARRDALTPPQRRPDAARELHDRQVTLRVA